jgi:hypothetical protein
MSLKNARDAVLAIWAANWSAPSGVSVYWHDGANLTLPDVGTVSYWLHAAVEFDAEDLRAFGGGIGANDRALFGSVTLRLFSALGLGEDTALQHLDSALAALRGRRSGDGKLTFYGASSYPQPQAVMDGAWWQRSALLTFEYRFTG